MEHEARGFDTASQMKQYRFIQCHIFGQNAEAFRFREPKTVVAEEDLVDKAIPTSTKYKNKWAVTIFNEW